MTDTDQQIGQTKKCSKCGETKGLGEYNKDRSRKDGLQPMCRACRNETKRALHAANPFSKREADKRYREENKAIISERQKAYRDGNADEIKSKRKRYRDDNKEKISLQRKESRKNRSDEQKAAERDRVAKWRIENKDRLYEVIDDWHKNHPDSVRKAKSRYKKKRLATTKGKLEANISRGIRRGLKVGSKGGRSTFDLLDYTVEELKSHLERQFQPGMTWDNYGEWHIDHIIPLTAFNYDTPDQIDFRKCWSLKNLQPLWGRDNMAKNNRLTVSFQPSLPLSINP